MGNTFANSVVSGVRAATATHKASTAMSTMTNPETLNGIATVIMLCPINIGDRMILEEAFRRHNILHEDLRSRMDSAINVYGIIARSWDHLGRPPIADIIGSENHVLGRMIQNIDKLNADILADDPEFHDRYRASSAAFAEQIQSIKRKYILLGIFPIPNGEYELAAYDHVMRHEINEEFLETVLAGGLPRV